MDYNPWYMDTYEPILDMANWHNFSADVTKKMVAIFSWMPQTIMAVKHQGNRYKYQVYKVASLIKALQACAEAFENIRNMYLLGEDLRNSENTVIEICSGLFPIMGSVAASKYLHFSAPRFFPMWDSQIRSKGHFKDNPRGYFQYMQSFKSVLQVPENLVRAEEKYSNNPIRGWDIVCMEAR